MCFSGAVARARGSANSAPTPFDAGLDPHRVTQAQHAYDDENDPDSESDNHGAPVDEWEAVPEPRLLCG